MGFDSATIIITRASTRIVVITIVVMNLFICTRKQYKNQKIPKVGE